jgi:predicted site-specific integrase-resolvase
MIKRLGYTIAEFSEISGLGRTTIFLEIKAGRLKAKRLRSRKTIILHDDAVEYLKNLPDSANDDAPDDDKSKT